MAQRNKRLKIDSGTHSGEVGNHEISVVTDKGMVQETGEGGSNIIDRFDTLKPKHKVFLSHSGAQKGFVDQLCIDLENWHRYPFFDRRRHCLPIGEEVSKCIFNAIQQCQVGVLVLSTEFFTRTKWPMLELVAMVREYKKPNRSIKLVPVFHHILREDWRDSMHSRRWIKKWKKWASEDKLINIEEWEEALNTVKGINSIVMEKDEVDCRRTIVREVCKVVFSETKYDDSHVQGKLRLCEIIRKKINLEEQRKGIQVMGLYGFGGIGKSTICKVLCNELFEKFQGRVCHVELGSGKEIELLHAALRRLTNTRHELLMNLSIDECRTELKERIEKESIFLAIDNVSDNFEVIRQARAYLDACSGEGSVVLVTARSLGELMCLNQYINEIDCIEMPKLEDEEARVLFLNHVTCGREAVIEMDEGLVSRCVKRCCFSEGKGQSHHYLPLALEVLGELLGRIGYDGDKWEAQLKKIDVFDGQLLKNEHPIFSVLRTSYDSLCNEARMLFMDVALFLPQMHRRRLSPFDFFEWLRMVHGSSIDQVKSQLEGLKERSLLENLGDGRTKIGMHDLWREFCVSEAKVEEFEDRRCVFLEEPSGKLGESSGSWDKMKRMCFWNEGWESLNGVRFKDFRNVLVLKVEVGSFVAPSELDLDLRGLEHLRSLELSTDRFVITRCEGLGSLRNLVFLRLVCAKDSTQCLGALGSLTKLEVLDVDGLKGDKVLDLSMLVLLRVAWFTDCDVTSIVGLSSKLTFLRYVSCALRECPGLDQLSALEVLDLYGCVGLRELPRLSLLTKLRVLDISLCQSLKAVPGLTDLVALEVLQAENCSRLENLPDIGKLTKLNGLFCASCTALKSLTCTGPLSALRKIDLTRSWRLRKIPDLSNFPKLEVLRLAGCTRLMSLTSSVPLRALEILDLEGCSSLSALPDHLSGSSELRELRLQKSGIVLDGEVRRELHTKCRSLVVFPSSAMSKYGYVGGDSTEVSGLDDMEINAQNQCRSRRLPDSLPQDKITRLVFSNVGDSLLALTSIGMHKLWDWVDWKYSRTGLKASVSFAPQFRGSSSGVLMINDISQTNPGEVVSCMAFSENDAYLISASGGVVSLFKLLNFEVISTFFPPPSVATSLAFHPHDNNILFVGMEDSTIQIYHAPKDQVVGILKGHERKITSLAFSTSLRVLVSLGADDQLCVWRTERWTKRQSYSLHNQPDGRSACVGDIRIQFHNNQVQLLVVGESQLAVYDASNHLNCLRQWTPGSPFAAAAISDATYSCDGEVVYVGFVDGSVGVIDAESLCPRCRLAPPIHTPREVSGSTVYPSAIAANPVEPNLFALGMTDGSVLVVEPLEAVGEWKHWSSADNGSSCGVLSDPDSVVVRNDPRADENEENSRIMKNKRKRRALSKCFSNKKRTRWIMPLVNRRVNRLLRIATQKRARSMSRITKIDEENSEGSEDLGGVEYL